MAVLVPDWPAPSRVGALFTLRGGGASAPPWDGLNLGAHVGDRPEAVRANRAQLQAEVSRRGGGELLFLNQVHGTEVLSLDGDKTLPQGACADGVSCSEPGTALVMMVADCLPVLLTDLLGRKVAAVHAGWRGLAGTSGQGVLESALADFDRAGMARSALLAWLGPCIGPEAFEVGEEVRQAFVATDPAAARHFTALTTGQSAGKWLASLPGLARHRLLGQGVSKLYGNDGTKAWCTHANPSLFFSHRRDAGRFGSTGRMAACIWRV